MPFRGAGADDARPEVPDAAEGRDRQPCEAHEAFQELLGKDAEPRYKFIMEKADQAIAEELDV